MRNVVQLAQKSSSSYGVTVGELVKRYLRVRAISRPLGESHLAVMNRILEMDVSRKVAAELESADIIAMAQTLREGFDGTRKKIGASTVRQYLTALRGPLKYAKAGWGMKDVSDDAIVDAAPLLDQLQLAGKSRPRSRRPESWEWDGLVDFFQTQDKGARVFVKMTPILPFARKSLRRRGEIVRLRWEDFEDSDRPMQMIRDMKDPKFKIGNHHRFPLLFGAADIIRAQPMVNEIIFPWLGKTVGKRFIDAKKALNIVDLRFHDLRRDGICLMLEQGYSPAQVAAVSGHKNWNTLARVYGASTNPEDVHAGPAGAQRKEDPHAGPAGQERTREEAERVRLAELPDAEDLETGEDDRA